MIKDLVGKKLKLLCSSILIYNIEIRILTSLGFLSKLKLYVQSSHIPVNTVRYVVGAH